MIVCVTHGLPLEAEQLPPRKQFGKAKRLSDFLNLIANTFLFGRCSFGVRQRVAALESGAGAPHSKKWRFQGHLSAPEPFWGDGFAAYGDSPRHENERFYGQLRKSQFFKTHTNTIRVK